jgi:hypothetical protein
MDRISTESTPLLHRNDMGPVTMVDPLTAVLPTTSTTTTTTTTNDSSTTNNNRRNDPRRELRRGTRGNNNQHRNGGTGTNGDASESSSYTRDTSLGSQLSRFNSSFRQISLRAIQYVAHHTGTYRYYCPML